MLLSFPIARALSFENDPPSIVTEKEAEEHRLLRKRTSMSPTFPIAEGERHDPSTSLESLKPVQVNSTYTVQSKWLNSTIHFMNLFGFMVLRTARTPQADVWTT